MKINLPEELMDKIHAHGEETYPEEGAGLLLGRDDVDYRVVVDVLPLPNGREDTARSPQPPFRVRPHLGCPLVLVHHYECTKGAGRGQSLLAPGG
jgi:proteasome lid subunit RPN8/RPN11